MTSQGTIPFCTVLTLNALESVKLFKGLFAVNGLIVTFEETNARKAFFTLVALIFPDT